MTLDDYVKEQLKDPAFKREYDALEDWYQKELTKQDALVPAAKKTAPPAAKGDWNPKRPAYA